MASKQTEPAKVAKEKPRPPPAAPSTHPMETRSKTEATKRMQAAAVQQRPVVHLKPPGATAWTWRFMQWFQRSNGEVDRSRARCLLCYQLLKAYETKHLAQHLRSRHHMRPPQRGH